MSFDKLSKELRKIMRNWVPTEIQRIAIPKVLQGGNLLLISPTGSGKTEAAILPVLQMLIDMGQEGKRGIRVIYITPLRALNRDMLRRMEILEKQVGVTVGVRHGDTPISERLKQSKSPPQVLITTPETFQLLFLGRNLRRCLENIRWVIIDEIHELAEDERGAQMSVALERLTLITKGEFQRIGLSATVGSPEEFARFLSGADRVVEIIRPKITKPMKMTVHSVPDEKKIEKFGNYRTENMELIELCKSYIEEHKSTLFFVNTRDTAEWLTASFRFDDEKFPIGIHHGSLSKDSRIQMEDEFKAGGIKALICTSSLELGIDVGNADFVLQYNSPRQVTRLVQRVGRSGHRLDRLSEGVIISANPDELLESAVIAKNASNEKYEESCIRKNPMTVLANQIVAYTMTERDIDIETSYKIITRAYPFRDLKKSEFLNIIQTLSNLREIKSEGGNIRKGHAAMDYFYNNISMIPDEKNYLVRDVATRKPIGTLDENFVASYIDAEKIFIFRGTSWRIVELQEDEILVENIKELGRLPSWAGEELPVSYEIAQDVAKLRRERNWSNYPLSDEAKDRCASYLDSQKDMPMADDKKIVIESSRNRTLLIINACFGTRVNETLGRYIAAMLSTKFGESVGVETDAYRITIETPIPCGSEIVERLLITTDPHSLESIMKLILRDTNVFRYQFLQVAKKFGAVRKDADHRALNINKLIDLYSSSSIYQEALQKTLWDKMDIEKTMHVLGLMQKGEIKIEFTADLSPIGIAGYESKKELVMWGKADKVILNALKDRLMRTEMLLACLSCRASRRLPVADINDRVKCWVCGSVLVSAIHPYERDTLKSLRKKTPTPSDLKILKRLQKSANLVLHNGKRAIIALAGRGIGADTAGRILERLYQNEEEFLKAILEAEVIYAKTRRFWD